MKMALSEFVLREKGIYGILHVIILILSLFLVISISVDTFKGIPFYEQSVYMKVQFETGQGQFHIPAALWRMDKPKSLFRNLFLFRFQ